MKLKIMALLLLGCTASQAGTMGDAHTVSHPFVPFASFEGSYTWAAINSTMPRITFSNQPWGGRIGIGATREWKDNWGLVFETGYGYYGQSKTNGSIALSSTALSFDMQGSASNTILGADILGGLSYKHDQVTVSAEAGMMVETLWFKASGSADVSFLQLISSSASGTLRDAHTAVLPELKVGGKYAINESLDLSLAYMHVFGSSMSDGNGKALFPNGDVSVVSGSCNLQVPTLNTILFGVHYNFV